MVGTVPAIAITKGLYTGAGQIISDLARNFSCTVLNDRILIEKTSQDHGISPALLFKILRQKPIAFNRFTHDREKSLSALKATLSACLTQGNCIFTGLSSHLIPDQVTHLLRILITASPARRINRGMIVDDRSEKSAAGAIEKSDRHLDLWVSEFKGKSPWDPSLYHLVLRAEEMETIETSTRLAQMLGSLPFASQSLRDREVNDFKVACDVEVALNAICQGFVVSARDGSITITLERKVHNLVKVQQQLLNAARERPGVRRVDIKIGPRYYRSSGLKSLDFHHSTGPQEWDTDRTKKQ